MVFVSKRHTYYHTHTYIYIYIIKYCSSRHLQRLLNYLKLLLFSRPNTAVQKLFSGIWSTRVQKHVGAMVPASPQWLAAGLWPRGRIWGSYPSWTHSFGLVGAGTLFTVYLQRTRTLKIHPKMVKVFKVFNLCARTPSLWVPGGSRNIENP